MSNRLENPSFAFFTGEDGAFPTPGSPGWISGLGHPWLTDLRVYVKIITGEYGDLPHRIFDVTPRRLKVMLAENDAYLAGPLGGDRPTTPILDAERSRHQTYPGYTTPPCLECTRAYHLRLAAVMMEQEERELNHDS